MFFLMEIYSYKYFKSFDFEALYPGCLCVTYCGVSLLICNVIGFFLNKSCKKEVNFINYFGLKQLFNLQISYLVA